ncbi:retrovirus-related pol polyprotein from transposon TNT 1-94 [Tanacetum coccineum]
MSSNSDDIQAAGSDTRPPMLDRTDYESWSQRIRLYCRGKENGLQILQSIDQGPFELGTTRDALGTTPEGGVLLGPERPRTYEDLSDTEKKRYDADVRATNIVLQGLPKDIYKLINHNIEAKAIWDNVKMLLAGFELTKEDRESQLMTMPNIQLNSKFMNNMSPEWDSSYVQGRQNQNQRYFARGNGTAGNGGAQNRAGNTNAGQGKPIKCYNCNGVGHIERNCTQPKRPQNSNYFKDKMLLMQAQENGAVWMKRKLLDLAVNRATPLMQDADECDAFDSDVDDEPTDQSIFMANLSSVGSANPQAGLSNASILSEVAIYEQRAKFELTEREHRMDDQMRMLIQNRNKTEENLKKELHSFKLQLKSTMENNKIIKETVTTLKQEFKQKESKFLTDFSNLKHLNDKLENKLHSQDQSIQTVHMMLNPTQPYHVPVIVSTSEEELELAEATRNKLHVKMNDSVCVEKRVNITHPNYSKENFMATFTPLPDST